MTNATIIPETAPFTAEQRAWLNGFLAGILARASAAPAPSPAAEALQPLTVLFGSQTGTAEGLAKRAAKRAGQRGFAATILDMGQTELSRLALERNLLVITSTYGEGEPPDNAKALFAAMAKEAAATLAGIRFSVCGLGDTNYVRFCQAAKDIDEHLERLGGKRILPRVDCDLDYEKAFGDWLEASLSDLGSPGSFSAPQAEPAEPATSTAYSKKNPFPSQVLVSQTLNRAGSQKQVQHVEFSLADSDLSYEAGDALGVWPQNCPELVAELLNKLGCDGEEEVTLPDGAKLTFRRALTERCDLGRPSPELASRLSAPAEPAAASALSGLHVADLILARPEARLTPAELIRMLRPLSPRLYSISSSPKAHRGQVHLTVANVRYSAHGRTRKGVCSTFLSERVVPGETRVGVFVHTNPSFRLPANPDTPIIMIGPGTGIAPFRAFLHERRALGAKGRAWLFFGDQHCATDFLYEEELAAFRSDGVLTRLDTAFSRDQEQKFYVQHRMLEQATEFYAWLEAGAHIYVCGDASRMAKDVDAALHRIVAEAGGKSAEDAASYVQSLRAAKRYARDVY
jgi:sulfite reductase (NADPH) flavoprotein alpha-component